MNKRTYNNDRRAEKAGNTKKEIIKTVARLWTHHSLRDITLEMIAAETGVTTRTILRKFGSKEGLWEACISSDAPDIMENRGQGVVGDIDRSLKALLANYEAIGEAAIRTIHQEPEMEVARKIGEEGRKQHRTWCALIFAPYLPEPGSSQYEMELTAFIASTEIYLWKLLRKDLGMSNEHTFKVFKRMVEGLILLHTNKH